MICHSCNNKRCANIEHLYLGNQDSNMDDLVRGKYSKRRALTSEEAIRAKGMLDSGVSQSEVSALFGISKPTVSWLKRGVSYHYDHSPDKPRIRLDEYKRMRAAEPTTRSPRRKLSAEQVLEIRHSLAGTPSRVLAERFGVAQRTILDVKHGISYTELV